MRPDTESWLRQARHDLQVAEKNLSLQLYDVVLVYCQQAVEKALKSLFIEQSGKATAPHPFAGKIERSNGFSDDFPPVAADFGGLLLSTALSQRR